MPKLIRSRQESSKQKDIQNICHGAATPSFGLLAHVSCWGPLWTWLGGYACPNPHIISICCHIRVRVLFEFSFPCETKSFIVTVRLVFLQWSKASSSCSPQLCRLVLLNWELEPHSHVLFIHIYNFRLRLYPFCTTRYFSLGTSRYYLPWSPYDSVRGTALFFNHCKNLHYIILGATGIIIDRWHEIKVSGCQRNWHCFLESRRD